jgi:hypothetical protein
VKKARGMVSFADDSVHVLQWVGLAPIQGKVFYVVIEDDKKPNLHPLIFSSYNNKIGLP